MSEWQYLRFDDGYTGYTDSYLAGWHDATQNWDIVQKMPTADIQQRIALLKDQGARGISRLEIAVICAGPPDVAE